MVCNMVTGLFPMSEILGVFNGEMRLCNTFLLLALRGLRTTQLLEQLKELRYMMLQCSSTSRRVLDIINSFPIEFKIPGLSAGRLWSRSTTWKWWLAASFSPHSLMPPKTSFATTPNVSELPSPSQHQESMIQLAVSNIRLKALPKIGQ